MFRQILNIIVVNVIKNKTTFQLSNYEKKNIKNQLTLQNFSIVLYPDTLN